MPGLMDDEIKNLQLDKPGRGKSAEQIRRHTVNEHFDNKPIERALYLLTKGDEVQKISIIQQLPQLVQFDENATYTRILPKIQQELPSSSCEFHINTSKVFQIFLQKPKAPPNLLTAVLQGIESRDLIVVNAWLETLIAVIPTLNEDSIRKEIIPIAVTKASLTQPVMSRIATCSILGKIAIHPKFKPLDIKKDILPIAQSLCQDVQPEVRASICQQLPNVAQGLGVEFAKSNLLPCLIELTADSHVLVRSAAISTIVNMLNFMNADTKKTTIVPLVKKLFDKPVYIEDITAGALSKDIGTLISGLLPCLSVTETKAFLEGYRNLARRGLSTRTGDARFGDPSMDVICRDRCAQNLPAILTVVMKVLPDQIEQLYGVFRELASDPCYIVRGTVGSGIQEVAKILGAQNKLMKPDIVRLLRDDAEEVLQTLVPNIGATLELFCKYGVLSKEKVDQGTMEIGRAMLKCQLELTKGFNWRLLTEYLIQLERLPLVLPSDFIHQHFTPVVLNNALNGRARPVREQAVKTLLMFLRYNAKDNQQKWLRDSLISELCYSNSCYTRRIFMSLCSYALAIFEEKYFRDYFFVPLLTLAADPVANIRLMFVNLIPQLNKAVASDQKLKQLLMESIGKLEANEKDKDVLAILKLKCRSGLVEKPKLNQVQSQTYKPRTMPNLPKQSSRVTISSVATDRSKITTSSGGDMHFLEQHFYIDAGITLPNIEDDKMKKGHSEGSEEILKENIVAIESLEVCNITDDTKVNLRKLSKRVVDSHDAVGMNDNSDVAKLNKRHSSIYSTTCLENQNRKIRNRRSLNIPSKEPVSRIPISFKHNRSITKSEGTNTLKSEENRLKYDSKIVIFEKNSLIPTNISRCKSINDIEKIQGSVKLEGKSGAWVDEKVFMKENVLPERKSVRQSNLPLFVGSAPAKRKP